MDLNLENFIFRFVPPMEKLGLNKTRLTDESLDFGSVGQSDSKIMFGTVFRPAN